jgi:hypothetical protein
MICCISLTTAASRGLKPVPGHRRGGLHCIEELSHLSFFPMQAKLGVLIHQLHVVVGMSFVIEGFLEIAGPKGNVAHELAGIAWKG